MPSKKMPTEPTTSDAMPTSEEEDYEAHSGAQPSNSVYDFLYQDVRRVASFLAQFEKYGPRTSVKASEAVGSSQSVKGALQGALGLPAVMGAAIAADTTTTDDTKDIAEHTFDPLWSNARLLLDYLASGDHIEKDAWTANVGSFIQLTGSIFIVDLQNIRTLLDNPTLRRGVTEDYFKANNIKKGTIEAKNFDKGMEIIKHLPQSIQMHIYADHEGVAMNAWATISNDSLTSTASDLILKHGIVIRGIWNVIGILDATPDAKIPTEENPEPKTLDEIAIPMFQKEFVKAAAEFGGGAREAIGRPREMFGVTPILVFREVTKAN